MYKKGSFQHIHRTCGRCTDEMNSQQIAFVIVLTAAVMCSAHMDVKLPGKDVRQNYCGRTLSNAMDLVCNIYFKDTHRDADSGTKRSDNGMYNAVLSPPYYKEQDMRMDWPWIGAYQARTMMSQRGKRQLIVSECCDKACSISELASYC